MPMTYQNVETLQNCLEHSHSQAVCLFKHSSICPTSIYAKQQVDQFLEQNESVPVYLIVVQEDRPLSNEIAGTLDVKHESPQFLVVKYGQAQSVLNHGDITVENIISRLNGDY